MLVYSNGSHRSRGSHSIALMVGNLTEDGRVVGVGCGVLSDYSECSECSDLSKLTQIQREDYL